MVNLSSITPYQVSRNTDNKPVATPSAPIRNSLDNALPQGSIPAVNATAQGDAQKNSKDGRRNFDSFQCETCSNRKYQDGSDDPGVSFKTPTSLAPEEAATAVRTHENEHVAREQASADREGRDVVSQSVSYQSAVCPECGSNYVSGGTTKTVTKNQVDRTYGLTSEEKGTHLDITA